MIYLRLLSFSRLSQNPLVSLIKIFNKYESSFSKKEIERELLTTDFYDHLKIYDFEDEK